MEVNVTDAEMIDGLCSSGDDACARARLAFRPRCTHRVKPICVHILRDEALAEDVVEDIYVDFIYNHASRLRSPRALNAYLRFMAIRRACRVRDREARYRPLPDGHAAWPTAEPTADQQLERRDDQTQLESCLARLTSKVERMVRLRFMGEMTVERVGEALGVSKQYVSRSLTAALTALRACMEGEQ